MTRLAQGRSTHLERSEIAETTLRLFDEGSDPSIRQLAKELTVTPSAIYHHFESRAEIIQAAAELVWTEILNDFLGEVGDPFEADPVEVLIETAMATRRGFTNHYTIAPYMAGTPRADKLTAGTLAIMANLFERIGLRGDEAADAFYAYAAFTFGTSLFAANRIAANAELKVDELESNRLERFRAETKTNGTDHSSVETRAGIDSVLDISVLDPERDEQLFALNIRRLVESLRKN